MPTEADIFETLRLELRRGSLILAVLGQLRAEHYGYTLRKALADAVQARAFAMTTHIPLGQYKQPAVVRNSVKKLVLAWVPVFWEAEIE